MCKLTLFAILFMLSLSHAWGQSVKQRVRLQSCQKEWQYKALGRPFKGTIMFSEPAEFLCGLLPAYSVALIKSVNGDTIRVLALCDFAVYRKGTIVTIIPQEVPADGINSPVPIDWLSCRLKATYFGSIQKIK
ncbi:hypothetical protein LJY25_01065 [Hymenobacter sp. BT175]|uniref:hypothetical protein n=1 Tax=Hymenobacter translucens TaxID=2886507 RepID=UPI001D0EB8EB|nr:hypothetical protein [Hymenobacter translucens]MCC2545020.1 hypothetical protein [Hymenobacter translucens]